MFDDKIRNILLEEIEYYTGELIQLTKDINIENLNYIIPTGAIGRIVRNIPEKQSYNIYFYDKITEDYITVEKNKVEPANLYKIADKWDGNQEDDYFFAEEWNEIKDNNPNLYLECIKKYLSFNNKSLPEEVIKYIKANINSLPEKTLEKNIINIINFGKFGYIEEFIQNGESIENIIQKAHKEAVYISDDEKFIIWNL